MADSGADSVTPINLAFTTKRFNMFVDGLLTGNSQPDVSSTPSTVEQNPGGEAETSSTTNLVSAFLNLPHYLKSCLDYCYFVLHNFYSAEKHRLGCLLMAEGLIKQDNSSILKEDAASAVIDRLISLGMLEYYYLCLDSVRIPSSYKKLGIGRVKMKNIFLKAPDSEIRLFIVEHGIDNLYPNFSGLSITSLFDNRFRHNDCKPQAYMEAICKLKSLVVLDLKGDIECLPDEIGELVHLKYLSLTSYKLINLDMANAFIKTRFEMVFCHTDELPVEVLDIQRLWHLMMNKELQFQSWRPHEDWIENINTLSELYLDDMHGELERRLQGIENYKIKNIPKVVFGPS